MDLWELEESKLAEVKQMWLADGTIFEKNKITKYDAKFFEMVTLSNTLIKCLLFLCLGIYVLINLVGLVLAMIYQDDFATEMIETLVGLFVICFIVAAIFSNINTNKKREQFPIYLQGRNFIFNFTDGVVETAKLFYTLPADSVQKIEFIIHGVKRRQLFGGVTFTFKVRDYTVTHALRYTNLTAIADSLQDRMPTLLDKLVVDGKAKPDMAITPKNHRLKNSLLALAHLLVGIALIVVPYALNFQSLALTIAAVILMLTAVMVFGATYLYTHFLVPGCIISSIFIIIGFCVPMLIMECSSLSLGSYIIQNPQILMTTIFGIIGLCLYLYILTINLSKLHYLITRKQNQY